MSLSIMAHPTRERFVRQLEAELQAPVTWDRKSDRWETGARALLAHVDTGSQWACVVQDDAILCRDFLKGLELVAEAAGAQPVGLYVGRPRPHHDVVLAAMNKARKQGAPWIEMNGPWWGVGIIVPTADIPELVAWGDRHPEVKNYDRRVSRFYEKREIKCLYTVPSLVEHRPVDENPSLIKGRTGNRRAHWFIGDRSPLEIDWSKPPVVVAPTLTFRHVGTKVEKRVPINTPRCNRMSKSPLWEVAT